MRIHLMDAKKKLLAMAILVTPFIMSIGVNFFGGLGTNGSFYPVIMGVLLWGGTLFYQRKIDIPSASSFYLLLVFLGISLASGAVNFFALLDLRFQGVSGIQRFIIQYAALMFYFFVGLYVYNVCTNFNEDRLRFLERFLLFSFIIPALYSSMELMFFWGNTNVVDVIRGIDMLFRPEGGVFVGRLRSVTSEPSYLGMYSAILFPWLCSLVFRTRGWKKIIAVLLFSYFMVINVFTFSRTSYMVLGIEMLFFLVFFRKSLVQRWKTLLGMVILAAGILFWGIMSADQLFDVDIGRIYLSLFTDDEVYDMSNIARYGSASAALALWKDFPILGCGFGAFGFYAADYYPDWAWKSVEIAIWGSNSIHDGVWPPAHNIYARILSETGIVGLIAWLGAALALLREEWSLLQQGVDYMRVCNLFISTIGIVLCGFNVDTFHLLIYWIIFGVVWSYKQTLSYSKKVDL